MKQQDSTAGIVIIGDEILSGRFEDENSPFLIKQLTSQGVSVRYCLTIPDDREIIAKTIREYSGLVDWLFTSGGIGPTPDDITMESLALAFDVPLVEHKEIRALIRKMYGDQFTAEHLRMAMVPEGTRLMETERPNIPVLQFRNITIFPGVPEFLRAIFKLIKHRFQGVVKPVVELNLVVDEVQITGDLNETLKRFPGLKLGSYPCYTKDSIRVKIIMEHKESDILSEAKAFLEERVGGYIRKD